MVKLLKVCRVVVKGDRVVVIITGGLVGGIATPGGLPMITSEKVFIKRNFRQNSDNIQDLDALENECFGRNFVLQKFHSVAGNFKKISAETQKSFSVCKTSKSD